jgi:hypothetical protein
LLSAPDILVATMTITYDAKPDVADHLEKLSQVTSVEISDLINILIGSLLSQIIEDHDTGLLQDFIHPLIFGTKEEALDIIARYESFVSEDESSCYHPDAKPARTRDGHWEILFKSTHPWDADEARYR